jgi:DNA-directed RNA polymerase subunit delta
MKGIISLIDIRKRVSESLVEIKFKELYNKIINDFLSIIKNSITFKYHKKLLTIDDDLSKNIFIFWNMIGSQNNSPDEIINAFLDNLKISQEKERNNLFERINNGLIGLDKDNIEILKYINNTNENKDNNINNIEEDKLEEQEEYDEDEIIENEDKLKYRDDIEKNEEIEEEEEEEENQELLDENDSDFKKLKPLNKEKYEFLINSINNIFELGPKIIKLLIDYMKHELLKEESNHEFDLTKFKELLEKKKPNFFNK